MVEQEQLLDRPRIELAVLGELEGDLSEPIRLARRVEAEGVRCRLGGPDVAIEIGREGPR